MKPLNPQKIEFLKEQDDFKVVLRSFPHIATQIESKWGTVELPRYINSLMLDSEKEGSRSRQGFPFEIASALMLLSGLHDVEFPEFSRVISNPFN